MPSTKLSSAVSSWADATLVYVGSSTSIRHINDAITINALRDRRGVRLPADCTLTPRSLNPHRLWTGCIVRSPVLCVRPGLLLPPPICEGSSWVLTSLVSISFANDILPLSKPLQIIGEDSEALSTNTGSIYKR